MTERIFRTLTIPNDLPHLLPEMPLEIRAHYDPQLKGCHLDVDQLDSLDGQIVSGFSPGLMKNPDAVLRFLADDFAVEWPDKWEAHLRGVFSNPLMGGGKSDHGVYIPECFRSNANKS